MDRRLLITSGLGLFAAACAGTARAQGAFQPMQVEEEPPPQAYNQGGSPPPRPQGETWAPGAAPADEYSPTPSSMSPRLDQPVEPYTRDELVSEVSNFFGVTAEAAGGIIQRVFAQNGQPTGYIAGQEGSGAMTIGARYGKGLLYMKHRQAIEVFWQGPSIGWDLGGNASRVFTLVYNLYDPIQIYQRFPGVEGSAYMVGGMGVNYQRASGVTLAPIRAGVGLRLGANIGYLVYSRQRNIIPF